MQYRENNAGNALVGSGKTLNEMAALCENRHLYAPLCEVNDFIMKTIMLFL